MTTKDKITRRKLSLLELASEMNNVSKAYRISYNTERPHQGRGMKGRTPADVFVRYLPEPKTPKKEKLKKAAWAKTSPGAATVSRLPYLYLQHTALFRRLCFPVMRREGIAQQFIARNDSNC